MKKDAQKYDSHWDDIQGKLSRYPLLMIYGDPKLCPVDERGFRLVGQDSPFDLLVDESHSETTYICIGGSTTFGWFVDSVESFPVQLETKLNRQVLNLGIPGLDVKNSLEVMMQVLRVRTKQLSFVFLLGVNEKTGFLQMHDQKLDNFVISHNLFPRLEKKIKRERDNLFKKSYDITEDRFRRFLNGQIEETISYVKLITKLCSLLEIPCYFFLQPHGLGFLSDPQSKLREKYLNDFYAGLRNHQNLIDISENCHMTENDFVDWQHPNHTGYKKISEVISTIITVV
jgi:hypothetical protein